jgi:hypothetical protein
VEEVDIADGYSHYLYARDTKCDSDSIEYGLVTVDPIAELQLCVGVCSRGALVCCVLKKTAEHHTSHITSVSREMSGWAASADKRQLAII